MQIAHKDSWGALRRMQCRGHQGAKFEHKMTQKRVMKLQGCLLSMKIQMGNRPSLLHGWLKNCYWQQMELMIADQIWGGLVADVHDCWSNMRRFNVKRLMCCSSGCVVLMLQCHSSWNNCYLHWDFLQSKNLSYFLCILQSDLLHGILQGYWIEELSCRSLLTKGTLQTWIQDWWLMLAYTFKWVWFFWGFISTSSLSLSLSPFSHPPGIIDPFIGIWRFWHFLGVCDFIQHFYTFSFEFTAFALACFSYHHPKNMVSLIVKCFPFLSICHCGVKFCKGSSELIQAHGFYLTT